MGHTQQNIAFLKTVSSQSISVQFARKVVPMKAIQAYGGGEIYIHEFLTFELDGYEWPASRSGLFIPLKIISRCPTNRRLDWPLRVTR
jgi:hypothetical protein